MKITGVAAILISIVVFSTAYAYAWHIHPEGEWDSNFGLMRLERSGHDVDGSYTHKNGRMAGTIVEDVVRGLWFQDGADVRCEKRKNGTHYWGRFRLIFTEREFTGAYGYCEDKPNADWHGHRTH